MKQLRESVTAVLLLLLLGCGALLVLSKPQLLLQDFRSGFTDAAPKRPPAGQAVRRSRGGGKRGQQGGQPPHRIDYAVWRLPAADWL